ncbi:MAG TPA: DMT family transporter [Anaerolineae bacterium]|nr:DMT family transporter [Anaerolineae bacterium]HMR65323.1 DMT family transporter [Anaerolineae bacterium]
MQTTFTVLIIGLIGGLAVGLQGPLASMMSQRLGALESSLIVHLGGLLATLIPLLFMGSKTLPGWRSLPWYVLGAGALGVVLVVSISVTIPRLGATTAIVLLVAGQLSIGALVDHFGLLGVAIRPVDWTRLLGFSTVLFGVWLFAR